VQDPPFKHHYCDKTKTELFRLVTTVKERNGIPSPIGIKTIGGGIQDRK
jgi:hypothetical protein